VASKYAKLKSKLPAFEQEQSYQERVDAWKHDFFGENPLDANVALLAAKLAELKGLKENEENLIASLNVGIEALSQLLIERMQADDLDKVSLASGATIYLQYEAYPSVKDKEKLLQWAKSHKFGPLLTLPWQTLRGICNEMLLAGKPLPNGVECFLKTQARIKSNGEG
jgi:hypothetical protein